VAKTRRLTQPHIFCDWLYTDD